MKLLLVLACLLLCGCSRQAPEPDAAIPVVTMEALETQPASMYDPEHPLEDLHQGTVKVYPLTMRKAQGIRTTGSGVIVFSGYGNTTLTLLTGSDLTIAAQITLDFELSAEDPSVQIHGTYLSFYDPVNRQTVVLNGALEEVSRMDAESVLSGSPILSSDRSTLYYCGSTAILAWDLESGIHRTVTELSYDAQGLTGLHCKDTVLECTIQDGQTSQVLFFSAETGQLLSRQDINTKLATYGTRYYATLPSGALNLLVFGDTEKTPQILYPSDLTAKAFYLPQRHSLVTVSILDDNRITLNNYELTTGQRWSELTLDALQYPKSIKTANDGSILILVYHPELDCDMLYRWFITGTAIENTVYSEAYEAAAIQEEALNQCKAQAAALSEKYGIRIRVWEDALAVQPWDYEFEAETLPQVLQQELELLDLRLSQYPKQVLEQTASHFSSLNLCLVRQITGTAASDSLNIATGIQFLESSDAYVVIAAGKYSEQALYHELFHVMETHILNESTALDQWNDLNPDNFEYTYGYDAPVGVDTYLSEDHRAFVDSYSMSFPKEDRARVFENAMLPGNDFLFDSPILQSKLIALCEGIRQAYGLQKSQETFLWEQYLHSPMICIE